MRFLKFLFSRFSIVTLLVLLQVAGFVYIFNSLDVFTPYYYFINLAFSAVGIFIVLVLINRQINPNYIVPWIVIILVFPVSGVVVYLMFSQNRLRYREKKRYRKLHQASSEYISQSREIAESLEKNSKAMMGQSHYLYSASKLPVYSGTESRYFPTGETFFESLKEELLKAEKFIFMEFFIIEKGIMWDSVLDILRQKVKSGVEVRFMYDDIGSITTLKSGYYKKLQKMGIHCVKFNRFLPVISAVHNNRDHRKIVVVDGKVGFMCGANLADEYINKIEKFGHWKDSAIMLKGEAVKSMTIMFLQMFNANTKTHEDFSPYLPYFAPPSDTSLGFVQPFGDGPMPLYLEKVCQNAILNMVNQAERYVYITTPYLIIDFQLTEALKSAAKRGVDVRIITPHIPDKKIIFMMTRSTYRTLIHDGVRIFEYTPGFIHSKNYLADDKVAMVGTMNMDYRSLVHHFECGVWMYNTPCISDIKEDIVSTIKISREVTYKESKLNPIQKLFRLVLQLFAPLL